MAVTVVDASAVAAVLFDEPESEPVLASITGALLAPTLLPYELASVCATKLARRSADAKITIARYRLFAGLAIDLLEPDWSTLPLLAREWMLSAYDATYLQIALAHKASLVTLDARLAAAYDKAAERC
jgi:predicted nucleic acid-binding protein